MPGRDGTGPLGYGPMTGRGLGPCGRGLAFRRGFGMGFGRGLGWRYWRYWRPAPFSGVSLNRDEELRILEEEKRSLEEELRAIESKIRELKG